MSEETGAADPLHRKPLDGRTPAMGRRVAAWSLALASRGVPTPASRYDEASHTLITTRINGRQGRGLVASRRSVPHPARDPVVARVVEGAMAVLGGLHRAWLEDLAPPPLDPFRRIRPRLEALARRDEALSLELFGLASRLERNLAAVLPRNVPVSLVHGDFHVGQLIFIEGTLVPWILDLDDLAIGAAEHDLGNFAAHLATLDDPDPAGVGEDYRMFEEAAIGAYRRHASPGVDPVRVRAFGAVALLRRGLKAWERRGDAAYAGRVARVAESLPT